VSSRYRSGRSKTWLKCKRFTESSFVILAALEDEVRSQLRYLAEKPLKRKTG
jgi:ATP-dependent DNA ligase